MKIVEADKKALAYIQEYVTVSKEQLAADLDWPLEAATTVLSRLHNRGSINKNHSTGEYFCWPVPG